MCAAIITQAGPRRKKIGVTGRSQSLQRRKLMKDFLVILQNYRNARLLKQDFRQPHTIGILCETPRIKNPVRAIPLEKQPSNLMHQSRLQKGIEGIPLPRLRDSECFCAEFFSSLLVFPPRHSL